VREDFKPETALFNSWRLPKTRGKGASHPPPHSTPHTTSGGDDKYANNRISRHPPSPTQPLPSPLGFGSRVCAASAAFLLEFEKQFAYYGVLGSRGRAHGSRGRWQTVHVGSRRQRPAWTRQGHDEVRQAESGGRGFSWATGAEVSMPYAPPGWGCSS
jgi:hypothetical protein